MFAGLGFYFCADQKNYEILGAFISFDGSFEDSRSDPWSSCRCRSCLTSEPLESKNSAACQTDPDLAAQRSKTVTGRQTLRRSNLQHAASTDSLIPNSPGGWAVSAAAGVDDWLVVIETAKGKFLPYGLPLIPLGLPRRRKMTLIQEMSGKVLLPSAAWLTKCIITRRGGPTEPSADIKAWICCSNHASLVEEQQQHLNRSGFSFRVTCTIMTDQTADGGVFSGAAVTIKLLVSSSSGGVKCGGPPGREHPCGCATISSRLYLPPVEKGT